MEALTEVEATTVAVSCTWIYFHNQTDALSLRWRQASLQRRCRPTYTFCRRQWLWFRSFCACSPLYQRCWKRVWFRPFGPCHHPPDHRLERAGQFCAGHHCCGQWVWQRFWLGFRLRNRQQLLGGHPSSMTPLLLYSAGFSSFNKFYRSLV